MSEDYLLGRPLELVSGAHLLAAPGLVEDQWDLAWAPGEPALLADPPLIAPAPWEDVQGAAKVIFDEESAMYRMWYTLANRISYNHFFRNEKQPGPLPGPYCLGYAESEDGLRWQKPELDAFVTPDGQRTNVVFWGHRGGQMGDIIPGPPGSDRRYAMVYLDVAAGAEGICLAWSDDGVHWEREPSNPVLHCASDCQNNVIFSCELERYVLITRPYPHSSGLYEWTPPGGRHMRRRIAVSTSPDLRRWTPIRTILYPTQDELPDFDNMTAMAYGNGYVGFLHAFDDDAHEDQRMTSYLTLSSDGLQWQRFTGEPFLAAGFSGKGFAANSVFVSGTHLPLDEDHIMLFCSGRVCPDDSDDMGVGRLAALSLRRDGFMACTPHTRAGVQQCVRDSATGFPKLVGPRDSNGYLLTREFVVPGRALTVNAVATGGRVLVEVVCRETTKPYDGYERESFVPISADSVRASAKWRDRADLGPLVGKPIMLRFVLEPGAQLYAFTVE